MPQLGDSSTILAIASLVLGRAGYTVDSIVTETGRLVVTASNPEFSLGVVEFSDATDLALAEHEGFVAVTDQSVFPAANRWDTYLVLVSSSKLDTDSSSVETYSITYDTRFVRRIVKWDTTATPTDVEDALSPFIPLVAEGSVQTTDILAELVGAMIRNGVSEVSAQQSVSDWISEVRS